MHTQKHSIHQAITTVNGLVSEMLMAFGEYRNGARRLSNGETLRDVIGDFHLQWLSSELAESYGAKYVGKTLIMPARTFVRQPGGAEEEVMQNFVTRLEALARQLTGEEEVRPIDVKSLKRAICEVGEGCVGRILEPKPSVMRH